nr:hypothetical protein [Tanacetum cinerariifolium]
MSSLFADTHNMVAILEKSDAAEVKRSDDVTRLQDLVDRKKIVISEDVIHEILQLDDAEGVETVAEDVANEAIPSTPTPLILPSPPPHGIPSTYKVQSSPHQQPQSSPQAPPQEHDKAAQNLEIIKLKARVKRLERANKVKSSKLRRLKKVGITKRIESSNDMEDVFNQGRMIDDLDKDEGIELAEIYHLDLDHPLKVLSMQEDDSEVQEVVEVVTTAKLITDVVTVATSQVSVASATISAAKPSIPAAAQTVDKGKGILIKTPKPMKKKDQIELDAEYARKLHEEINKDHEKINKSREEMEEEDQEVLKSINETPAQKAAKRRKLNEKAQEVEDLKKHLEVVDDEDDDVFTEATPLAKNVPVVDYHIVLINNKPRFKIIKADKTHQLYISFITLLKNFDREDLEDLWRIVKERFSTSKPSNFSNEYLLTTLKKMFEKPDGQDAVWKSQRSVHGLAMVKSWKLLTSCGVHIITLSTIQLILLVERRYPLSKFTLEQLVNVTRLQVEEELLELMLLKRSRKNTKCVNAADEELTADKHKLMLLVYCC